MELSDPDGTLGCRTLVYLDTADWSYLESGKAAVAETQLRELGRVGKIALIVSLDHFVEASGLTRGRWSRVHYMHDFPGTLWLACSGYQITDLAIQLFAARCLDLGPIRQQFLGGWLAHRDVQEFEEVVRNASKLRRVFGVYARAAAFSNTAARTAHDRKTNDRLLTMVRKGDRVGFRKCVAKSGVTLPGWRGQMQRLAEHILFAGATWARRRGLVSALPRADWHFERCVGSRLPPSIRGSRETMLRLHAVWSDETRRAEASAALACVAALDLRQIATTNPEKMMSSEIDKLHAAFAPLTDVFTCDKRNQPTLAAVLAKARHPTRVLRTGHLDEVADLVSNMVEHHPPLPPSF